MDFLEKRLTAYHIYLLTEKTLKYLISPEYYLPEYLSFNTHFINWKKTVTVQMESNESSTQKDAQNIQSTDNKIISKENIVEHIVKTKCEELIGKMYKKSEHLNKSEVRNLLDYIVKYYVKNKMKMETADMKILSKQIVSLFPNESKVGCLFFVLSCSYNFSYDRLHILRKY